MKFESTNLVAEKLGVNVRTVQKWAKEGKIDGAIKEGRDWKIPTNFISPNEETLQNPYFPFLSLPLSGGEYPAEKCLEYINEIENPDQRNIALGEYYYYKGEPEKASEILEPYIDSDNLTYRCTSLLICSFANICLKRLHIAEFALKNIRKSLEEKLSKETDVRVIAVLVFIASLTAIQLHFDIKEIPDLKSYIKYLPDGLKLYACYLLAYTAYFNKDYSYSYGIADTALKMYQESYPIAEAYLNIISAVDLMNMMRTDEARIKIQKAWDLVGKDGLIMVFVEHHGILHGMIENFFKKDYPQIFNKIIKITKNFHSGWSHLHNAKTGRTVAGHLTTMEFTVAMLFNRGWRIKEIASHIGLSERTVKNYLQIIYEKLGINNKRDLEKFMLK